MDCYQQWPNFPLYFQQGFFWGGLGVPWQQKFCPSPNHRPHFLTKACPPSWVLSPKILSHFSLNFDNFLSAQNCIRKCYFMLKTPKFAQILLWGHFWPQRTILLSSPHLSPLPPTWCRPWRGPKIIPESKPPPPPKILWKNPKTVAWN